VGELFQNRDLSNGESPALFMDNPKDGSLSGEGNPCSGVPRVFLEGSNNAKHTQEEWAFFSE
jgi:hypothetical protein